MLAAPGADLVAIEDAVVVRVYLLEPRRGPLSGTILGALNELVPGDAARGGSCRGRRRGRICRVDGGGLRRRLGDGRGGKQKKRDKGCREG